MLGINHLAADHDDHEAISHHQQPKSTANCPKSLNWNDKYLVSTLNSPDCPLMHYDEALNYCTKLGLKPVSLSLSSPRQEILAIAKIIPQESGGFWTDGFINKPGERTVYWHDMGEDIDEEIWADGQPDGPVTGRSEDIEFCVSVQKSSSAQDAGGKLHDRLCHLEMAAVCERNIAVPNLDLSYWMNILPMRNN